MLYHSLIFTFLLLITYGCSTSPKVDQVSKREIDRTYTLPKDVFAFNLEIARGKFETVDESSDQAMISLVKLGEGGIEQSISDDTTVLWGVIPLAAKYQISHSEKSTMGLSLGFKSLSYSTVQKFNYEWYFLFSYKYKLSSDVALKLTPYVLSSSYESSDTRSIFETGGGIATLWQHDNKGLLSFSVKMIYGRNHSRYFLNTWGFSQNNYQKNVFGADINLSYKRFLNRNWRGILDFTRIAFGYGGELRANIAGVGFEYLW